MRIHFALRWTLVALSWTTLSLAPAMLDAATPTTQPADQQQDARFLRFVGDGTHGGQLQTSEVTYRNDAGVIVHLVAAVHIGEPAYYHELQKSFKNDDAVLYEMVSPKGSPAPVRGQHSDHAVTKLQRFLKDELDLSYQLDEIDYNQPNFIHADLDLETFEKMQSDRGESFASLILSSMLRSLADPSQQRVYADEPTDLMDLMTRPDGEDQVKLLVARRLGDIERGAMGLDMLNGTVILTERNKAVIKTLQKALKDGHKKIAIFFGAAHMFDLSDRLDLMGFKPVSTTWRTAWDVHIRPDQPSMFMNMMAKVQSQMQPPK